MSLTACGVVFCGAGATAESSPGGGQVPRTLDQPAHTITGKGTAAWREPLPKPDTYL